MNLLALLQAARRIRGSSLEDHLNLVGQLLMSTKTYQRLLTLSAEAINGYRYYRLLMVAAEAIDGYKVPAAPGRLIASVGYFSMDSGHQSGRIDSDSQ